MTVSSAGYTRLISLPFYSSTVQMMPCVLAQILCQQPVRYTSVVFHGQTSLFDLKKKFSDPENSAHSTIANDFVLPGKWMVHGTESSTIKQMKRLIFMSSPDDGSSIQMPVALIRSVVRQAERNAIAVASFLDGTGHFPARAEGLRSCFPSGFMLELAAILQLKSWENQGFRIHVDRGLPCYKDCATRLCERVNDGDAEVWDLGNDSLYRQVLKIQSECFSWEAEDILGEPVAIYGGDDDQFVEEVASFLWEHRDLLSVEFGEQVL